MNDKLEQIRKNMQLNKQEFCKKLDITYQTYQNYLNGRDISTDVAIKLKSIFNININWLLANTGNMFNKETENNLKNNIENEAIEDFKKLSPKRQEYYYYKIKADVLKEEIDSK
jgi:transcriptional regulator with XRE-family HTH domain